MVERSDETAPEEEARVGGDQVEGDDAESAGSTDAAESSEDIEVSELIEGADSVEVVESAGREDAGDLDEVYAEMERLRVENERLKTQPPAEPSGAETSRAWRWFFAVLLVVLGSLVALGAIGAYWVNTFVMDTDTFVGTLAPLAEDPAIQQEVASAISDEVLASVDVEAQVGALLEGLQDVIQPALEERGLAVGSIPTEALVVPLSDAIEGTVRDTALDLVSSPQFAQLFEESLRVGHEGFLAAVQGAEQAETSGLVVFEGNSIYVDVNAFAKAVQEKLVDAGLTIVGDLSLERAQGRIVLTESSAVPTILAVVGVLNTLAWLLPLLTLGLLAGAVFLAPDRRTGLILIGAGLVTVTVLALLGANIGSVAVLNAAEEGDLATAAIAAAYDILPAGLIALLRLVLGLGVLLVAGAVVMGPAAWAVSLRTWFSEIVSGTGSGAAVADVARRYRTPLIGGGVLVGIAIAVFWPGITAAAVFWVAVAVLVWIVLVETLARSGAAPRSPTAT